MADKHLHTGFKLAFVPGFSFLWRRLRGEYRSLDTGLGQHRFDPAGYVALLRVRSVNLNAAPVLYFRLDQFDQLTFLGVEGRLRQIWRVRNEKSFPTFRFLIVSDAPELSHGERPVGIEQ